MLGTTPLFGKLLEPVTPSAEKEKQLHKNEIFEISVRSLLEKFFQTIPRIMKIKEFRVGIGKNNIHHY